MGQVGPPITFNVNKMLEMRVLGHSYSALGRYFHKDHTTVIYHCKKYGIVPFQKPPPPKVEYEEPEIYAPITREKKIYKYPDPFEKDGFVQPAKTYKQYLAEALKRPVDKQYHKTYYGHYRNIPTSGIIPYFEEEA